MIHNNFSYCVSYVLAAFLVAVANANNEELRPIVNFSERFSEMSTRIFSVSTTSPLTRKIRDNPSINQLLLPAYDYIDKVWSVVDKRRSKNNSDPRACNLYNNDNTDWATIMSTRIEIFQIGVIDKSCFSQIDVMAAADENEISREIAQSARQTFINAQIAIKDAFGNMEIDIDGNWTKGQFYTMRGRRWKRSGQECSIDSIFAHRKDSIWYLRAAATNIPRGIYAGAYGRHFIQEFIPRDGEESLKMPIQNINTGELEASTTVVTKWDGTGYSIEADSFDDPVSPLAQAFRQNIVEVDISSDATTPSNTAILALPMFMNLIPVAFVADPQVATMFVYILITDIFSTIPFLAKGIELIRASQPTQEVVFAFFSGNGTTGTMQSWAVDCAGERRFQQVGIAFVIVAILALVGGVVLEIWAKHYMQRKKQKQNGSMSGPFGTVGLDIGRTRLLGTNRVVKRSGQFRSTKLSE